MTTPQFDDDEKGISILMRVLLLASCCLIFGGLIGVILYVIDYIF